jgi:glycosyltransferase involved in cell wall biosynthesis
MIDRDTLIVLIAPNLGEQMGGEALKALHIFQQYKTVHPNTIQIVHQRNQPELDNQPELSDVFYIKEDLVAVLLWHSVIFRKLLDVWFSKQAVALAEKIADSRGLKPERVIIHQTEPNSPVAPRAISKRFWNAFGPINGNIYYPAIFREKESLLAKSRRLFHFPMQRLNALLPNGLKKADIIFAAGGDRTTSSLLAAGCHPSKLIETLDCGIKDEFLDMPRIKHIGKNYRFIHFGRLVYHKGTALIIKSLLKTELPICLDIVGKGPEFEICKKLTQELGLSDRVHFLGWYEKRSQLFESFRQYRGVVLPSIEDANGIVIQEAMALGLPAICLDWGGPKLLIDHAENGFLVEPVDESYITTKIAEYLDLLAKDDDLAESFSLSARKKAQSWRWSIVAKSWLAHYDSLKKDKT